MKNSVVVVIIPVFFLLLSSCGKEDKKHAKMLDGTWSISLFQLDFYQNNVVDSTYTQQDCGTITFTRYKEYGDFYLTVSVNGTWPNGSPAFVALGAKYIYSDSFLDNRMVFANTGGSYPFAYNTMEFSKSKVKIFVYMFNSDGTFSYKETVEFSR
jgi:hypothetical protein